MDVAEKVITAVIGLCVGTLMGNEISRFLYRPRVIIKFKKLEPMQMEDGFFWSIQIANMGRTVASKCVAHISLQNLKISDIVEQNDAVLEEGLPKYSEEKIDLEYPRHQLVSITKFRDISHCSLCWSRLGNPEEIDINPGTLCGLDICRVQYHKEKQYWYLIFPSEKGWRKVRIRIKAKNYKGRILVCPANNFPTMLDFEIKINDLDQPTLIPVKYNFIERVFRYFKRRNLYFG